MSPRDEAARHAVVGRLDVDGAVLAVLIGAMNANGHVSAEEAARAHHIIWSMRRFRRKRGEVVNRQIEDVKRLVEQRGGRAVVESAARGIPARLRRAAYAVAADLVLVDGRLEAAERRYLEELGTMLKVEGDEARKIVEVMLLKNSA